jgi:hypothetical protein
MMPPGIAAVLACEAIIARSMLRKATKVVSSCNTPKQYKSALKYLLLMEVKYPRMELAHLKAVCEARS